MAMSRRQPFVRLAHQAVQVAQESNGRLGVSIASVLGFEDTHRILEACPFPLASCRCWHLAAVLRPSLMPCQPWSCSC